ncbi:MAG: DUF4389 domain-containing protein [Thiopseudomonas sp.]|nr:DUF4389 domain-containing protein [Thiopseudomonas sp.]
MDSAVKRLRHEALFFRILWMLVFGLAWQVAAPVLLVVVVLQLLHRLLRGEPHAGLMRLGDGLGGFLAQIARYSCFRSDDKPWPVADWPLTPDSDSQGRDL